MCEWYRPIRGLNPQALEGSFFPYKLVQDCGWICFLLLWAGLKSFREGGGGEAGLAQDLTIENPWFGRMQTLTEIHQNKPNERL